MDITAINEALQASYGLHQAIIPLGGGALFMVVAALAISKATDVFERAWAPIVLGVVLAAVFATAMFTNHNIWWEKQQDQAQNLTAQVEDHYGVSVDKNDMNMVLDKQRDGGDALYRIEADRDGDTIPVEAQISGNTFRLYTQGEELAPADNQ